MALKRCELFDKHTDAIAHRQSAAGGVLAHGWRVSPGGFHPDCLPAMR